MKNFYFGCPNCIEPETSLENPDHVKIKGTVTHYGSGIRVIAECSVCGSVEEIEIEVIHIQTLKDKIEIGKGIKGVENGKGIS